MRLLLALLALASVASAESVRIVVEGVMEDNSGIAYYGDPALGEQIPFRMVFVIDLDEADQAPEDDMIGIYRSSGEYVTTFEFGENYEYFETFDDCQIEVWSGKLIGGSPFHGFFFRNLSPSQGYGLNRQALTGLYSFFGGTGASVCPTDSLLEVLNEEGDPGLINNHAYSNGIDSCQNLVHMEADNNIQLYRVESVE
jgi:hypothetical protein